MGTSIPFPKNSVSHKIHKLTTKNEIFWDRKRPIALLQKLTFSVGMTFGFVSNNFSNFILILLEYKLFYLDSEFSNLVL